MTAKTERVDAIRWIQTQMADYGLTMEGLQAAGCFDPPPPVVSLSLPNLRPTLARYAGSRSGPVSPPGRRPWNASSRSAQMPAAHSVRGSGYCACSASSGNCNSRHSWERIDVEQHKMGPGPAKGNIDFLPGINWKEAAAMCYGAGRFC